MNHTTQNHPIQYTPHSTQLNFTKKQTIIKQTTPDLLHFRKESLSLLVHSNANTGNQTVVAEHAVEHHQQHEEQIEHEEERHVLVVQQHRQSCDYKKPSTQSLHAAVARTMQEGVTRYSPMIKGRGTTTNGMLDVTERNEATAKEVQCRNRA